MIQINETYALDVEPSAWVIKKAKKDGWTGVAWYAKLDQAIEGLYDLQLRNETINSIGQLQSKSATILAGISRALSPDIRRLYGELQQEQNS